MSRMMPGRVRAQGIELYETGQLTLKEIGEDCLVFQVGEDSFRYAQEEEKISCSCGLFAEKAYCSHLAAVEYFLKNDPAGKEQLSSLNQREKETEIIARKTYAGGVFLDQLLPSLTLTEERYALEVEGQLRSFEQQIDWTLKIRRYPDQRSYIIRDIGAFLKIVQEVGHYQIGKNYYELLSLEQFDQVSQDLILFLWRLLPSKSVSDGDILLHFGRNLRLPLAYFEEGMDLLQDLSSFRFDCESVSYEELKVVPYQGAQGLFGFEVLLHQQMIELVIHEKASRSLLHGYYLLVGNVLYGLNARQRKLLLWVQGLLVKEEGLRRIQLDFQDQQKLALVLYNLQELGYVKAPDRFQLSSFSPEFSLSIDEGQLILQTRLAFPNDQRVSSQAELDTLPFTPHFQELERIFQMTASLGFTGKFLAKQPMKSPSDWYSFLKKDLPRLQRLGHVVLSDELLALVVEEPAAISVEQKGSLLDISFDFSGIDPSEVSLVLEALLQEEDHYISKTGQILVFDDHLQKVSRSLLQLRAKHGRDGKVQVKSAAAYALSEVLDQDEITASASFQKLVKDMTHPEQWSLPSLPITAQLREYQERGVRWLSMLDHYGFGGILADDMGLGKTLQAIAFLSSKVSKDSRVLILAPSSLIYNWQEEFKRFAPQLDVAVVYGNKLERQRILEEDHSIVVTSYPSFRQDSSLYQDQSYDYLMLDEAQVMKNAQTKIAQQLREFEVGNCFALSGTPIENNVAELWSIFQIVLPGLLPAQAAFQKLAPQDIARMIKPFVLRRKKEDVLLELPDLIETTILNELSEEQKVLYLAQLHQMQGTIKGASEQEINRNKIEILAGITRLRQICNTPSLFMDDFKGSSGKLDSLRELLFQLKEGGHRVLIFSQFRQMLELIEGELESLGLTSYLLTGSTPASQRQDMTRDFNGGSRDAFLISLKAGGVGLNLTGADTVILVDLWWNPAVEEQAISRAYRMGQTRAVECYRLITRGTIEEKIQALQENKKNLVTALLDGNENKASMTPEEIKEILGIS